jgi:hypothetical protein
MCHKDVNGHLHGRLAEVVVKRFRIQQGGNISIRLEDEKVVMSSLEFIKLAEDRVVHGVIAMDSAFLTVTNPKSVVVLKGMEIEKFGSLPPEEWPGKVYHESGFISTSLGPAAFKGRPVILHLLVPEGVRALYIASISNTPSELELLIHRDKYIHIRKVVKVDGKWHVYGEILRDPPPNAEVEEMPFVM